MVFCGALFVDCEWYPGAFRMLKEAVGLGVLDFWEVSVPSGVPFSGIERSLLLKQLNSHLNPFSVDALFLI